MKEHLGSTWPPLKLQASIKSSTVYTATVVASFKTKFKQNIKLNFLNKVFRSKCFQMLVVAVTAANRGCDGFSIWPQKSTQNI